MKFFPRISWILPAVKARRLQVIGTPVGSRLIPSGPQNWLTGVELEKGSEAPERTRSRRPRKPTQPMRPVQWRPRHWGQTSLPSSPAPKPDPRPSKASRSSLWSLVVLLAIFSVPFMAELMRVVSQARQPFFTGGDYALAEIAVSRATHFEQLLGSYSRFGWSHPGPMLFYFLAPFYSLFDSALSLWFGTVALNFAMLATAIALVHRHQGLRSAIWVGLVLSVLVQLHGPWFMENPWNPSISAIALLACVVATACRPSLSTMLVSIIAGSFAVQTHVGLTGVVGALFAIALGMYLLSFGPFGERDRKWLRGSLTGKTALWGVAAAAVCWLPVAIEAFRGSPSNLVTLGKFLAGQEQQRSFQASLELMISGGWLPTSPAIGVIGPPSSDVLSMSLLLLSVSGVAAVVAYIQRQRFPMLLCAYPFFAYPIGAAGFSVATGDVLDYMLWWVPVLQTSMIIGIGLVMLENRWLVRVTPRVMSIALGVVGVLVMCVVANSSAKAVAANTDLENQNRTDVEVVWSAARSHVDTNTVVMVDIQDGSLAPLAAGVVAQLQRDGIPWEVSEEFRHEYTRLAGRNPRNASMVMAFTRTQPDDRPIENKDTVRTNGAIPATVTFTSLEERHS